MPAANEYFQMQFIPNYWKLNITVVPQSLESRYKPVSKDMDLREIFCLKEQRSMKRDHTLSWDGEIF